MTDEAAASAVGHAEHAPCVFAKALLAAEASCECSRRSTVGERLAIECRSPPARANCATLLALLQERGRFALKLQSPGRPMTHMQALRLQCGGLAALRQLWRTSEPGSGGSPSSDVHQCVLAARQAHGSLSDLPWTEIIRHLTAWQPPRRRRPGVQA